MEGKKSTWNRKKIINWIQCFNGNKCLPLRPSQCLGKDGQSCPITFVGRWAVKSQPLQCTRTNYGDSKPQLEWSKWPFHGIKGVKEHLGKVQTPAPQYCLTSFLRGSPSPLQYTWANTSLSSVQPSDSVSNAAGQAATAGRQRPLIARLLWGWTWSFTELLSWWDSCNCL